MRSPYTAIFPSVWKRKHDRPFTLLILPCSQTMRLEVRSQTFNWETYFLVNRAAQGRSPKQMCSEPKKSFSLVSSFGFPLLTSPITIPFLATMPSQMLGFLMICSSKVIHQLLVEAATLVSKYFGKLGKSKNNIFCNQ